MSRLALFIDYQNAYKGARAAFGWQYDPDFTKGQLLPRRLGVLITDRGRVVEPSRSLSTSGFSAVNHPQPTARRAKPRANVRFATGTPRPALKASPGSSSTTST